MRSHRKLIIIAVMAMAIVLLFWAYWHPGYRVWGGHRYFSGLANLSPVYVLDGRAVATYFWLDWVVCHSDGRTITANQTRGYVRGFLRMQQIPASDGDRHVLYQSRSRSNHSLYELDVETGTVTELRSFPSSIEDALYSPDRTRIAVVASSRMILKSKGYKAPHEALWLYSRETGKWRLLDDHEEAVEVCSWSKAGDRIFYRVIFDDGSTSLKQIVLDSGTTSTLLTGLPERGSGWVRPVLVADNARRVIFAPSDGILKQVDAVTGKETILRQSSGRAYEPKSIDSSGRYLAMSVHENKHENVEVVDLNSPQGVPPHLIMRLRDKEFAEWHPSLPRFLVTHYGRSFIGGYFTPVQVREYHVPGT